MENYPKALDFEALFCTHLLLLAACHRIAAEDHGIPERVMLSYLQGEIEGEAAVKNLPATKLQLTILISYNAAADYATSKSRISGCVFRQTQGSHSPHRVVSDDVP